MRLRLPTQPLSRAAVVVAASVVLHVVVVVGLMASSLVRFWPTAPAIEIEVVSTPPTALPLEPPAPPAAPPPVPAAVAKKAKPGSGPKGVPDAGADAAEGADAGIAANDASADAAGADGGKPGGLRADGPEGARLVVRLKLDRLREAPQSASFTALADELLKLLPDRHRLIDGSGLNIFADFDTMVVATPNPLDDAVTFLAVHHHVPDPALALALGRAATANARPIEWTTLRGRPVGLRPPGAAPSRDDRVFVLPEPGWAVIAPAAYMRLLVPELMAPAGAVQGGTPEDFGTLAARLRGEEAAMGPGVVLMASASQLLAARPGQKFMLPGSEALQIPKEATLRVRLDPDPVLELTLGFADAAAAAGWTTAVPALCRQFANHPMAVLVGMSAAITRVSVVQTAQDLPATGADVLIKAPLSSDEAARMLGFGTNLLRGRLRR